MAIDQIQERVTALVRRYPKDLEHKLTDELQNFKLIYLTDFGIQTWKRHFPILMWFYGYFPRFPRCNSKCRTLPPGKRIENVLRTTICHDTLSSVGVLAVDTELAENTNLDNVVNEFALNKARMRETV